MCYHWNEELNAKKNWDCSKADGPYNRQCANDFIAKGKCRDILTTTMELRWDGAIPMTKMLMKM